MFKITLQDDGLLVVRHILSGLWVLTTEDGVERAKHRLEQEQKRYMALLHSK